MCRERQRFPPCQCSWTCASGVQRWREMSHVCWIRYIAINTTATTTTTTATNSNNNDNNDDNNNDDVTCFVFTSDADAGS